MKYSKKDIKNITKNLDRIIFIESSVNKEEFKQIKLKGIYFPYLISSYGRVVSVYYKGIKNNTKENPKFLKPIVKLIFNKSLYYIGRV